MKTLVLSTVGTSALTNPHVLKRLDPAFLPAIKQEENDFRENARLLAAVSKALVDSWKRPGLRKGKGSAEIASLFRICDFRKITANDGSVFVFFYSDTKRGECAARAVVRATRKLMAEFLCHCHPCEDGTCEHLQLRQLHGVNDDKPHEFAQNISSLPTIMFDQRRAFFSAGPAPKPEEALLFNVTGAYKGLIPFVTSYCNRPDLGFTVVYLFEGSPALVIKRPDEKPGDPTIRIEEPDPNNG